MEKRLLTAFALSAAILLGWQLAIMYLYPPAPPEAQQPAAVEQAPVPGQPAPAAVPPLAVETVSEPAREFTVVTDKWRARFSTIGGVPTSWQILEGPKGEPIRASDGEVLELIPQGRAEQMGLPFRLVRAGDDRVLNTIAYRPEVNGAPVGDVLEVAPGETVELTFTSVDPTTQQPIVKRFTITGDRYDLLFTAQGQDLAVALGPRIGDQSVTIEDTYSHVPSQIVLADVAGEVHYIPGSEIPEGAIVPLEYPAARWAGLADSYFGMVMVPGGGPKPLRASNIKAKFTEAEETPRDFLSVHLPIESGVPAYVFVGPKAKDLLEASSAVAAEVTGTPVDLEGLINYGWFSSITRPLTWLIDVSLDVTNRLTHNYGWAIILLTTAFNLIFFPLKYKSTIAMRRSSKLQPKMKELQEKMKKHKYDDPEFKALQKEQMALMKEMNPMGGCLPMLLQLPFFWAFFVYLTTDFSIRQEPWILWVRDLSAPDPYYILPVLMVIAQIGATMIMPMPATDDPAMKLQRQLMTWVMPIVFAYFFLASAPSGVVLYWMTLNLVNVAIQLTINRMLPPEPPAEAGLPKSGKKSRKPGATSDTVAVTK